MAWRRDRTGILPAGALLVGVSSLGNSALISVGIFYLIPGNCQRPDCWNRLCYALGRRLALPGAFGANCADALNGYIGHKP